MLRRLDLASELSSQQRTAEAAAELDTVDAARVLAFWAAATTQNGGERSTTPEVLLGLWSVSYRALVGVVRREPMRGLWPQWEGGVVQPAPSSETQTGRRGLSGRGVGEDGFETKWASRRSALMASFNP